LTRKETESIVFKNGITQIVHFENYTHVKNGLYFLIHSKVIGKNALQRWTSGLVSIKGFPLGNWPKLEAEALQNCSKISVLTIPGKR